MSNGIAYWLSTSLLAEMVTLRLHVCMCPAGATANENRGIRQQAATFVLRDRLLYYRATDVVNEISLKRVIAKEKEEARIIRSCHDGVHG